MLTTRCRNRVRIGLVLVVAGAGLLLSQTALAQALAGKKGAAIEHFEKAEAHMAAGAYADAIREYKAAYAIAPKPGFNFNIARAYELKGDKVHALEYYLKYLEMSPDGRASTEARTRAVALEHEIADEGRAREKDGATVDPGEGEPDAADGSGPATTTGSSSADTSVSSSLPDTGRRGGRGYKIAGASLGGAGMVMLGAAVYYSMQVSSAEDDLAPYYEGQQVWDERADDLEEQGRQSSARANLLYGVGAGALVGGAVLYYLGWKKGRSGPGGVAGVPRREGGMAVTWACEF